MNQKSSILIMAHICRIINLTDHWYRKLTRKLNHDFTTKPPRLSTSKIPVIYLKTRAVSEFGQGMCEAFRVRRDSWDDAAIGWYYRNEMRCSRTGGITVKDRLIYHSGEERTDRWDLDNIIIHKWLQKSVTESRKCRTESYMVKFLGGILLKDQLTK